jgi:hypothetical protein
MIFNFAYVKLDAAVCADESMAETMFLSFEPLIESAFPR